MNQAPQAGVAMKSNGQNGPLAFGGSREADS